MAFSQLDFIFIFLPVFLLVHCILPKQYRGLWMTIASLGFYVCGTIAHPEFILILVASLFVNYFAGRGLAKNGKGKKAIFALAVLYNVAWLVVFKYLGFITTNLNELAGLKLSVPELVLPLGISFYTFQSISYLADVYKGKTEGAASILDMAVFILMFPKLTSGPIARYPELKRSIDAAPEPSLAGVNRGFLTFTLGLGMKVLLADRIGAIWTGAYNIGFDSISTPHAWLSMIAYAMQLYFDFAGYSMMAIGIGEMIGIKLPDNFDDPYLSKSVSEFWRRWHITLGAWFRDYIYIPLGGNREGLPRTILNLFVVWLLTGLWHGASW
ncbi:MAG: MBOAT family protein, partial [Oscillospiraceae bacterium]|nr:MBOAT family protein [Oscillospiraceae bacterium]